LNYGKLQKRIDSMEEDKKAVELEIQRILKDKNITELNLRWEILKSYFQWIYLTSSNCLQIRGRSQQSIEGGNNIAP